MEEQKKKTADNKEYSPEEIGFSGFTALYCMHMSNAEKDEAVLAVFPDTFWGKLGVTKKDVFSHAGVLCGGRGEISIAIKRDSDAWIDQHGINIFEAMEKATVKNGELSNDHDFIKKCDTIKQAELQMLGFAMLSFLSEVDAMLFFERASKSLVPEYALQMWAGIVCFPLAKDSGLIKKKHIERTTFFSEIVEEIGFVQSIHWIRTMFSFLFRDKKSGEVVGTFEQYVPLFAQTLLVIRKRG